MNIKRAGGLKVAWIAAVDRLMKRDWCINTADAGLSADDLARYWQNGEDPAEFVAWFAEKYDLIRYEPLPIRTRPASSPPRA